MRCPWTTIIPVLLAAAFVGSAWGWSAWARYGELRHQGIEAGERALFYLRCRLEGGHCPLDDIGPQHGENGEVPGLAGHGEGPGSDGNGGSMTVFAAVYQHGRHGSVLVGEGNDTREALRVLGDRLIGHVQRRRIGLDDLRLRVDFLMQRGPVIESVPLLFALSVVPGLDGIGLRSPERTAWLLPYELWEDGLLTVFKPFPFMDLRFGVDRDDVLARLHSSPGAPDTGAELFRFRTESYIEREPGVAMPLYRGSPPSPPVTREAVERAVVASADWILSVQGEDGRFHYLYDPLRDRFHDEGYSLSRHAGTVLFLLQAFERTGDRRLWASAEAALDYLWEQVSHPCGRDDAACVGLGPAVGIGPSALAMAALVEHHRLGGAGSLTRARQLGSFLLMMQAPDGNFHHRYEIGGAIDPTVQSFYQTGEAVYALALLARAQPDEPAYREAVRRALEFWVGDYWDHFAGGFFFVEEHWTCLAIEAAYSLMPDDRYASFCDDIAHFLARLLHDGGSSPFPDYPGGAGFGVFFPPHTTPTASRVEAMVAAYRLSVQRGRPDAQLANAIRTAYGFLLAAQYDASWEPLLPRIQGARGGFRESPLSPLVRIDYNQHAGSALLRGLDASGLIPER